MKISLSYCTRWLLSLQEGSFNFWHVLFLILLGVWSIFSSECPGAETSLVFEYPTINICSKYEFPMSFNLKDCFWPLLPSREILQPKMPFHHCNNCMDPNLPYCTRWLLPFQKGSFNLWHILLLILLGVSPPSTLGTGISLATNDSIIQQVVLAYIWHQ